ncbi:response regulator [Methylocystis sp. MJC1]|uniref:response regulator n=1 Tax=Methylocystis sp. MJC1 TaxID=2654282 RepID=UPI0013EC7789|nr:response regulator [Methylocystis sp. MJC1]MBU6527625.1 response regulator [Methylocystis sp. MJC1]UZX10566.1 response regulator [Methylocystis sp. MJC1]
MLEAALSRIGWTAVTANSAQEALGLVSGDAFPIAFVDARLPDMDGFRLSARFRIIRPGMSIILISGYFLGDDVDILDAMRASTIDGFLAKPFQIEAIAAAVDKGAKG